MKSKHIDFKYSDFAPVKNIALTFPNTEESISYEGTPSVNIRSKLMCRLHENGEFIAIRFNFQLREKFLETYPEIFHLPDHYKAYPWICMWIHNYEKNLLMEIVALSWKGLSTEKQIQEWNDRKKTGR